MAAGSGGGRLIQHQICQKTGVACLCCIADVGCCDDGKPGCKRHILCRIACDDIHGAADLHQRLAVRTNGHSFLEGLRFEKIPVAVNNHNGENQCCDHDGRAQIFAGHAPDLIALFAFPQRL